MHLHRAVLAAALLSTLALAAPARAQLPWDAAKKAAGKATVGKLEKQINQRLLAEGRANQWVRNVAADPRVRVEVDGRSFPARVTDVTGAEGAEVVLRFVRRHPWYARLIVWLVGYVDSLDRPDDELRRALAATPVFAVRPDADGSGSRPSAA